MNLTARCSSGFSRRSNVILATISTLIIFTPFQSAAVNRFDYFNLTDKVTPSIPYI